MSKKKTPLEPTPKALTKKFPESDKLLKQDNVQQTLRDFIEWLYDGGYSIRNYETKAWINPETIVFDFMGVNPVKLEKERREMLKTL